MKHKFTILFCLVMFIYISGFISGRLIKPFRYKDVVKTEQIKDKIILQNRYKLESQFFIDSANSEMYNYSIRYYNLRSDILPDTYVSTDGEVIMYNKENFFKYYSKYKITDYLSKAKSSIINNLLMESKDTVKTKVSF